jgi:hypothetical protein
MGKCQFRLALIKVKQSVGAATLLFKVVTSSIRYAMHAEAGVTRLIHILAKQETAMKARRRVLGRVPARLNTRVTMTRSMLVLLRAEEMVKPPISSMIVGENMVENTNLV